MVAFIQLQLTAGQRVARPVTDRPCGNLRADQTTNRIRSRRAAIFTTLVAVLCVPALSFAQETEPKASTSGQPKPPADASAADASAQDEGWKPLFNGKDMTGWKVSRFGGEGDVFVEDNAVVITQGAELSGIHTEQDIPRINYEVQFEAQRAAGSDFFAAFTFPVGEKFCSLILGGWGGGICGLSSLDGMDASENDTTSYREFEKGKWYKIRLVVTDKGIDAWVDGNQIVAVETEGRRISVRFEMERSKPMGFATWQTTGKIRNARIRPLPPTSSADK